MEIVLDEPETDFGQIGGFSYSIYAAEGDDEGPLIPLRFQGVAKNVHPSFGRENLHAGLGQRLPHGGADGGKSADHFAL